MANTTPQDPNYQDILTKYADSLKSTESPPKSTDEGGSPTMLEPDPAAQIEPESEPQTAVMTEANTPKSTDEGGASTMLKTKDQVVEPKVDMENPVSSSETAKIPQPEVQVPPSMQTSSPDSSEDSFVPPPPHPIQIAPDMPVPPKENHFFKYLFFFSLVVFIVVVGMVVLSFVNSQKSGNTNNTPTTAISPTVSADKVCEINGQKYAVGQTFTATDGCNSCSCTADLAIVCTEKACESSTSAIPTESATVSATKAPTKTPTATTAPKATIVP